jgi:GMP synthase (glutamine-hydrolysing)
MAPGEVDDSGTVDELRDGKRWLRHVDIYHPTWRMNPVLCLRNDRDDTLGIAATVFGEERLTVAKLDAFEAVARWPELDEISGLVVFGGEMNVDETDRYPYLLTQRQLMRRAVDAGLPVLGICLGAQILARALDARVYRAPVRELGFKPVRVTDAGQKDALIGAFQTGDRVFQWHEDTFELPAGAELLATGDDVPVQAFRMGPNAWGVQFHFEVDADGVNAWLRAAEPSLERVWKRSAEEVRDELRIYLEAQQQRSRVLLTAFAERVRSGHTP